MTAPPITAAHAPDGGADQVGRPVGGSLPAATQAHTAALRGAYATTFRQNPASCAVFGVGDGPRTDLPIHADDLVAAHALIAAHYADHPDILQRAAAGLRLAANAALWTIREDGSVTMQGHKRYQVSADACPCMDFRMRQRRTGGVCKHLLARELLRLAQVRFVLGHDQLRAILAAATAADVPPDALAGAPATAGMASIVCPARPLAAALVSISGILEFGYAATCTLQITDSALQLTAEKAHATIAGDGDGQVCLTLTAEAFRTLYQALRPVARTLDQIVVIMDAHQGQLSVASATTPFAVVVPGRGGP